MCKKKLQKIMIEVVEIYRDLLAREMRGPSDSEGAMRRLQSKFGLDYAHQWALRYRAPKKIAADLFQSIKQAHISMLEQSVKRDLSLLQIEIAKGVADADTENLVADAKALLVEFQKRKIT